MLLSISKSVEGEPDSVIACAFRCLKLIVSTFISQLSGPNFSTCLVAIHMFAARGRHENINSCLQALAMFQNVADYISKRIRTDEGSENDQDYLQGTWLVLFS